MRARNTERQLDAGLNVEHCQWPVARQGGRVGCMPVIITLHDLDLAFLDTLFIWLF